MFKKLKSFLGFSKSKAFGDWNIQADSSKYKTVNLETHPQCPRYVSFTVTSCHFPNDDAGVFEVEAASLLQWLNERGRSGEATYREWLSSADVDNEETYQLLDKTVFDYSLEFMIGYSLENGKPIKALCPSCNTEFGNDDMKLIQESSSGWVYRFVDCKCGNKLASYEVMHFIFRAGTELPKNVTSVIKDYQAVE